MSFSIIREPEKSMTTDLKICLILKIKLKEETKLGSRVKNHQGAFKVALLWFQLMEPSTQKISLEEI